MNGDYYCYVATVNGQWRLNMPRHVSASMEYMVTNLNLTEVQMFRMRLCLRVRELFITDGFNSWTGKQLHLENYMHIGGG